MSGRRHRVEDRQVAWHFSDPEQLIRDEEERGDVVFEAPDASRIVSSRPPRLPRVRQRRARTPEEPESMGLPFGTRAHEGGLACWSCGQIFAESEAVSSGPGTQSCPGCGARLPFA